MRCTSSTDEIPSRSESWRDDVTTTPLQREMVRSRTPAARLRNPSRRRPEGGALRPAHSRSAARIVANMGQLGCRQRRALARDRQLIEVPDILTNHLSLTPAARSASPTASLRCAVAQEVPVMNSTFGAATAAGDPPGPRRARACVDSRSPTARNTTMSCRAQAADTLDFRQFWEYDDLTARCPEHGGRGSGRHRHASTPAPAAPSTPSAVCRPGRIIARRPRHLPYQASDPRMPRPDRLEQGDEVPSTTTRIIRARVRRSQARHGLAPGGTVSLLRRRVPPMACV